MSIKAALARILTILILTSSLLVVNRNSLALATEPSKLAIYVGPTSVPADNSTYECIFVQLQDSRFRPARALNNTTISLSSSLTTVGDVDHTITIGQGSTYAVAKFYSTFTPGTTTIAATASGYATVQKPLTTVGPVPSTLAVYAFPPTIPADGNAYPAIVVQIQDSSGNPARAPLEGLNISLTCSNITVGTIPNSVIIQGGNTHAVVDFKTGPGVQYAGTAEVIAIKEDYVSRTAIIRTQEVGPNPTTLRVYAGPTKITADNIPYERLIAVQLLNDAGVISRIFTDVTVNLASSEPLVGTVPSTITIPAGKNYGFANFASTYRSGMTTITAGATGYKSSTTTLSTVGPVPSKLVVYCGPSALPADNKPYEAVQVQVQDSSGNPARDPDGNVTVSLFSSEPKFGTVPTTLTIAYGKTYAATTFASTYQEGSTTITAQASGYLAGQAVTNSYMIDQASLQASISSEPSTIDSGGRSNIVAYVTYPGGAPVAGATVKFTSSNGGTFTSVTELGNGFYNATFTAPTFDIQTQVNITATTSKAEYATDTDTTQITVLPPPSLDVLVTAEPDTISSGGQTSIVAYVTYPGGTPVTGATVRFTSSSGGTLSSTSELGNGFYNTTFKAPSFYTKASVNITASASKIGYATSNGTVQVTVLQLPSLEVSVTAEPRSVDSGGQSNVVAYITYSGGEPVTSATVKFTSSSGGTFSSVRELGNGFYNATFTAPSPSVQTYVNITASASKIEYATSNGTTQITVFPFVQTPSLTLILCVRDDAGQPVSEAIVSTLSTPTGMRALLDITNSTGYVTFPNATEGNYTFNVIKQGYDPKNMTFNFENPSSVKTLLITKTGNGQFAPDLTLVMLIIVAIAVIIVIVIAAYIQRRKTAKRFQVPKKWEPPQPPKPRSETSLRWQQIGES